TGKTVWHQPCGCPLTNHRGPTSVRIERFVGRKCVGCHIVTLAYAAERLASVGSPMTPKNRTKLANRVISAAEATLAGQHYVAPVDVFVGIGWLDSAIVKRWRQGQIDDLESVVHTNLSRISEAMRLFRSWATSKGLFPSETAYVARTPQRET